MVKSDNGFAAQGLGALLTEAVAAGSETRSSLEAIAQLESAQRPSAPVAPAWLRFARWGKRRARGAQHALLRLRELRS